MDTIIFDKVEYSYGKEKVINQATFSVREGAICGFVGANGAGKTTVAKLVLSIMQPKFGEISIFGNKQPNLKKIGAIIGGPAFYGEKNAYDNLAIVSYMKQNKVDPSEIINILELVGLEHVGKKKVKNFSMGMQQRLSIGMSMLGNPKLLIWDEPLNGLDPDGIREIRELIKKLNTENKVTFFISSHILSELDLLIDDVVIINKGTILFSGEVKDFLEKYGVCKLEDAYMKCLGRE